MSREHTSSGVKNILKKYSIIMILIISFAPLTALKAQDVRINLSDISKTMKKYIYTYIQGDTAKTDISYIVVKASDGTIKTCFDACDACYIYHKGLSQSDTNLRCNSCGNRYHIIELGVENRKTSAGPDICQIKLKMVSSF